MTGIERRLSGWTGGILCLIPPHCRAGVRAGRLLLFLILFATLAATMAEKMHLPDELLSAVQESYGKRAMRRLVKWQDFILDNLDKSEEKKLKLVNRYFNLIPYASDSRVWNQNDYWATPAEFLVQYRGDCEDYSIAKYFTLREMGVEDEKLRIMYVKGNSRRYGLNENQAHVVLGYYATPTSEPLILDNLTGRIQPASKRKDLTPIYSYNARTLWKEIARGRGINVRFKDDIEQWYKLMLKIS